jgi:O-antigen/teichoic acid export membrane protein
VVSASARVLTLPVTAAATFVTTFLLVKELGVETYAYVILVGALFQLIPFADLGMGAAVVNASAKRLESRELSATALATAGIAFRTLAASATAILALAVLVGLIGAWPSLLGLPPGVAASSSWAIAVVLLPFALSIPFGIGQRILVGEGRNHVVSFVGIAGPTTATATTYVLLKMGVDPLVLGVATPLGILIVSVSCFVLALRASRWRFRDIIFVRRIRQKPRLWNSALPMIVISITVPLAMQSDRLVLSHFSEARELSEYSIAAQMYVPCFSIISMAAVALWPIFSRSGSASITLWSKAIAALGAGGGFLAVSFVFLVGPVAHIITEGKLTVGLDLAAAFGSLLVVMACHQASAVLLTSPMHLAFQALCSTAMLVLNLALSIYLAPIFGASGVVWASVFGVFVTQLIPCIVKAKRFMRTSSELVKV